MLHKTTNRSVPNPDSPHALLSIWPTSPDTLIYQFAQGISIDLLWKKFYFHYSEQIVWINIRKERNKTWHEEKKMTMLRVLF